MESPSFKEDHISQIPALQLLLKLGYRYLTSEQAMQQRGNKTTSVFLEDVLRKQLEKINSINYKGNAFGFSPGNIQEGVRALKDLPMHEGYMVACEHVYNLLTLGKALEQSIDGDKKSFTIQYIDWQHPENNVFHVTEEFNVMRSTSKDHYRPDLVLFVNGIPICIIECKHPGKEMLKQAISQQLRSQQEDGIRVLYVYSQILFSIAFNEARFATNATEEEFWSKWEEKFSSENKIEEEEKEELYQEQLREIKNEPLPAEQKESLFSDRFRYVRSYFDALERDRIEVTVQDEYLYALCRPERLLDLIFNFIVFEGGEKKIARYQQYFAIKKTMQRIQKPEGGKRRGGVIWHTQGSGKSLTMVMLAQAIALDTKHIQNPKIILVTDRIDLDSQITGTFQKCKRSVENAVTGQRLVELLDSKSDAVITTVINKFEAAVRKAKHPFTSPDIFVLVDEGHRTQYGSFNIEMQKTLPNACFIAFTGTPLLKREKNTAAKFGGLIDTYVIRKAVEDEAVVPILYEGRHAMQKVNENPIDTFFALVSEPLTDYQKTDLKKKFSRADHLNITEQKIYAICWDISMHFRDNWQGTVFKAQLVCQSKEAALKYKKYLDEIGIVTSEVLISGPDEREGEESAYEKSSGLVKQFWDKMMNEHGTAKKYQDNIISRVKHQPHPEIIIVVDKLTTGFDSPINTVLYLTRSLREHRLLQTIARVNRVYQGKEFGYVIDYYGVLEELDEALRSYSDFEDFDEEDLSGTMTNISEEVKKLPQKHSELWDIFKTIRNKRDAEAFESLLRDEVKRPDFYDKVSAFSRSLKIALSSIEFHRTTDEKTIKRYKEDVMFFLKLRISVMQRFSDRIDYSQYEDQIQKLIDKHIESGEVKPITELVNIFDKEKFEREVEKVIGEAAKADRIASRTAKHINEKMEEDPAFYKKFSEMLKDAIREFEQHRISEAEYLRKTTNIMNTVLSHTDEETPEVLSGKEAARAYFGLCNEYLNGKIQDNEMKKEISTHTALAIDKIIDHMIMDSGKPIIDWQFKSNITGKLQIEIGDYLIDEVRNKYHVTLTFDETDTIAEKCIDVAKVRYR